MRVFVTGATGFVGIHVVKELIAGGHQVLGLSRSESGAQGLLAAGAEVQRGSMEDVASLQSAAEASDAVLHLAFNHDFSKFQENCQTDKRTIEALGAVLAGSDRPLMVTSGVAGLGGPGRLATEDDVIPPDFPFPRVSEQTALSLKGVNASVMRLSQIHDTAKAGLITYLVGLAREKGMSAYVEATGHPDSVKQGLAMIRKLGRFVEFSVFSHDVTVDWSIISDRKMLDVLGAHLGPYCYPFTIEAIGDGRLPTEGVVTHQLPLEKFKEGMELMKKGDKSIKVLLIP